MKIALGGDHAGVEYKKAIVALLQSKAIECTDFGPFSSDSVDYPDFTHPVANAVEKGDADYGILLCGSANGVAITANKHAGIRAGLCWNEEVVKLVRQHNNANVLCIPARFVSQETAIGFVELFLETPFEGGRHATRVEKIACL